MRIGALSMGSRRYSFSSCLRTIGVGLGQFWPNLHPVIWPEVTPCNFSVCGFFNGNTALDRDTFFPCYPIGHDRWRHTYSLCDGKRPASLHTDPFIEFHARIISHGVMQCQ